jgi:dCMP deaminase
MTPTWDIRFLQMARMVAQYSKDPSTKCGAVIVRPNKTVVSTGFNGFPAAMEDRTEWYEDRQEKYSRIIHCEVNALIHAYQNVTGFTLYTYPFACCDRCVVQMIGAGIARFVYPELPDTLKDRWGDSLERTKRYMIESHGVSFCEYGVGLF